MRRRYSRELKDQILAEREAPGASVAKVAPSKGINASVMHGLRKLAGHAVQSCSSGARWSSP
ncbi:transposase [Roseateles sp.]|uniref:transposase n=1 Tax=Roseateles sp. TaxID=1971397 RepID=UPI0039EA04CC